MYSFRFSAVSGSDWAEIVEVVNDATNLPLTDIDTALIELEVQDRGDSRVLFATTADGTITRPASGKFQWRFTKTQMAALCPGTTYSVGCRFTTDGGTTALFTGNLAYIDGEIQ